jgi:hypothetical protein
MMAYKTLPQKGFSMKKISIGISVVVSCLALAIIVSGAQTSATNSPNGPGPSTLATTNQVTPGSAVNSKLLGPWDVIMPMVGRFLVNISVDPNAFNQATTLNHRKAQSEWVTYTLPNIAIMLGVDGSPMGFIQVYVLTDGSELIVMTVAEQSQILRYSPENGGTLLADGPFLNANAHVLGGRTTSQNLTDLETTRKKQAISSNLNRIGFAAKQLMNDRGVTQADYSDIVGTQTSNYIRSIDPQDGEDYTHITVTKGTTQISVSTKDFGDITYNL